MRDENGKKDVEKEQWYWDEGMKQVRKKFEKFDQVILSDESIWYCLSYRKKSVLRDLQKEAEKDHFQIKVIVYLRRQDDFLLSRWNQFIKQNMSYVAKLTCDEYFNEGYKKEEKLFEYDRKLDEIAEEYIGDGAPAFSETVEDLPKWSPRNDAMPQDAFRFFTAVIADIYRENEEQKTEIRELKKEVESLKMFRDKIKHPSKTILNKLTQKGCKEE